MDFQTKRKPNTTILSFITKFGKKYIKIIICTCILTLYSSIYFGDFCWFIEYGYPLFTEKGNKIKQQKYKNYWQYKFFFSYLPWKKIRINNGSFWPKVWMLTRYIYLAVHVKNEIPFIFEKERKWPSQGLHLLCMSFVLWVFFKCM